ncbi:MAG: ABC transporter ATP-binding protein [Chloroflexota bacterium]|nr:MAG: ABC transporter ATP-binding protein [Chloroflexota bacterium]
MKTFLRALGDSRTLWKLWVPLLLLAMLTPPLVLALPLVEKKLIDEVILARQPDLLLETLAQYVGLWLVATVFQIFGATLATYLTERITLHFRHRVFAHCETLSLAFSRREHSGRTLSLFANDVPSLTNLFSSTVAGALGSITTLLLGAALMFVLSPQLAIIAGVAPPLVSVAAAVVTRPLRPATRRAQEKAAELTERIQENLAGIREIVAFGQEHAQRIRFLTTLGELLRLRMRVVMIDTAIQSGQSLFSLAVTLVILGYGGYLVMQGDATVGTLVAMNSLFGYVFQPAGQLLRLVSGVQKALGAADRVYEFLDQKPQVQERVEARVPSNIRGCIAFDDVSFEHVPGQSVLADVSLTGQPGQVIALVGPSGAGKTTLVSLIARFYDPIRGRVLLDGTDLRDLSLDWLRSQIAIVFQDTYLFATSIRENIAFGRDGASETQIIAAARSANAWEFIERLPNGLDTLVGERGTHLSEGQKQRLSIARAILRDPRILILDEPTSALDARSEHQLQAALDNLMLNRTTFVIAHRLATVQRADRILVIENGRIVEQGTHAELLAYRGVYRELFDLQFAGARPAGDALVSSLS